MIAFENDVPADPLDPDSFSHPGDDIQSQIVNLGVLGPGSGTYTETRISVNPILGEDLYEYNAELHMGKEFFQKPDTVYWIKIAALVDTDPNNPTIQRPRWGWHNRDYTIMDPFAAAVTPPVDPGERNESTAVKPYPTEVWHFQDDAVSADTQVEVDINMPNMPLLVLQTNYVPQNYVDGLDGPAAHPNDDGTITFVGISRFSKDLAFELYTVPEPSSVMLMMFGLAALTGYRRRHPPSS